MFMTAHYRDKNNKIHHFKVSSVAEIAKILDSSEHFHNSVTDLVVLDEDGIYNIYNFSFGSFVYPELINDI